MILSSIILLISIICTESAYYEWSSWIGGQGGSTFLLTKRYSGQVIKKFEVWQGGWQLRGIRITYTDGTTAQAGRLEDRKTSFTLDIEGNEKVTELSIWGNGAGTRCGAFRIKTNKGRTFFPRMYDWGLKTEYKTTAGGGLILGLYGRAGSDIDSLCFMLIRPIRSLKMGSINYDLTAVAAPTSKSVYDITIPNPSESDSDRGSVVRTMSETRSAEWSISASLTFGQSYTVEAGIPKIATVGKTTTWEISVTTTYSSSWSETVTDAVSIPVIVPKLTKTRIFYFYYRGTADVSFSGRMYVTVNNGDKWTYSVSGSYKGVDDTKIIGDSILVANYVNGQWVDAGDDVPIINLRPIALFDEKKPTVNNYEPLLNVWIKPNDDGVGYKIPNYNVIIGAILIIWTLILTVITFCHFKTCCSKRTKPTVVYTDNEI